MMISIRFVLLLLAISIAGCAASDEDRTPFEKYLHQKGLE